MGSYDIYQTYFENEKSTNNNIVDSDENIIDILPSITPITPSIAFLLIEVIKFIPEEMSTFNSLTILKRSFLNLSLNYFYQLLFKHLNILLQSN